METTTVSTGYDGAYVAGSAEVSAVVSAVPSESDAGAPTDDRQVEKCLRCPKREQCKH